MCICWAAVPCTGLRGRSKEKTRSYAGLNACIDCFRNTEAHAKTAPPKLRPGDPDVSPTRSADRLTTPAQPRVPPDRGCRCALGRVFPSAPGRTPPTPGDVERPPRETYQAGS